jgi:ankyrin repeat protein
VPGERIDRLAIWLLTVLGFFVLVVGGSANAVEIPLVQAAKRGDISAVRTSLAQNADVNSRDVTGATAVLWAAHRDDLALADLLIRSGATVDSPNRYGMTPLIVSCNGGSAAMIELLLNAGADPNGSFGDGETALMTAARAGSDRGVRLLLDHGARVNAVENRRRQTALMWAAAEGHTDVVRTLIDGGAAADVRSTGGFTALLFAVREGHLGVVRALLEAGADPNDGFTGQVSPPSTEGIVRGGGTPQPPTSALVLAVMNAHFEIAAVLLNAGADPNASQQGWTALHEMTWVRRPNLNYNPPGPTPTGSVGSLDLVRKLVAAGADVNARLTKEPRNGYRNELRRIGATPFLLAAKYADIPLMRLLVDLGADPLIPNADNSTSLMVAAGLGVHGPPEDPGTESEVLEAVKLALELGGDVNAVDNNGETAIHGATYRGLNAVVQLLVDSGAKVNIWNRRNSRGWTPLDIAHGVFRSGTLKAAPHTEVLLRRLLAESSTGGQKASVLAPTDGDVPETAKTIWSGVFTETQAARGRQAYEKTCARCHLDDLRGSETRQGSGAELAPSLIGDSFFGRWTGSTVGDKFSAVSRSMPYDSPGRLDPQTYIDIVSYVLKQNAAPAGDVELTPDPVQLGRIRITERPSD